MGENPKGGGGGGMCMVKHKRSMTTNVP